MLLQTIVLICSTSAIENNAGKWTKLGEVSLYNKNCIVKLYECAEKKGGVIEHNVVQCLKEETSS